MKNILALTLAILLTACDPLGHREAAKPKQAAPFAVVQGTSMEPTLRDGQIVALAPVAYSDVRGGMIVAWRPDPFGDLNVKRVDKANRLWPDNPAEPNPPMRLTVHNLAGWVQWYYDAQGRMWIWEGGEYRRYAN